MKLPIWICFVVLPATAADFSYVGLNRLADRNSLVRVSADGGTFTTITNGAAGNDLTKDRAGNYIVAAVGSLLRVTPSGVVSTIAKAPKGSQWMSVIEDAADAFIVADNMQHAVWRVSADGLSVARIWNYPAQDGNLDCATLALDGQGNYLLLENSPGVRLFRITPAGDATPIPLSRPARFNSHLIVDPQGNYVFMEDHAGELLRVAPASEVTILGKMIPRLDNMAGLAQDPRPTSTL